MAGTMRLLVILTMLIMFGRELIVGDSARNVTCKLVE
jgi:hypothetical protein